MSSGYYSSYNHQFPPLHLCFFFGVLLLFMALTWYINYELMLENLIDQVKLALMVSPLLFVLVVHWLSDGERKRVPFFIPLPEKESLHRAGGTPWGVAALLVFLMFMISYQSYFHGRWFPLLRK
uniref:Uncharacterized protein n=1 Tax=Nelumbo nucifera TaxID=4432 RepID=A0A822YFR0_NELNU|nr:TPA_asm: hypothetical protein HUJ06_031537 [Nelumbo nucifera]